MSSYIVRTYFKRGEGPGGSRTHHDFTEEKLKDARKAAEKILLEGITIINEDETEDLYPVDATAKVRIIPQ